MEINFRITEQESGYRIDCNPEPNNGGLTSGWSHMADAATFHEATEACALEIAYQWHDQHRQGQNPYAVDGSDLLPGERFAAEVASRSGE